MTAMGEGGRRLGVEGSSKKKKDTWTWTSVVIVVGREWMEVEEGIKGINSNGKIQ